MAGIQAGDRGSAHFSLISPYQRLLQELRNVPTSYCKTAGPLGVHLPLHHHPDRGVGGATIHYNAGIHVEDIRDGESLREETKARDLNVLEEEGEEALLH